MMLLKELKEETPSLKVTIQDAELLDQQLEMVLTEKLTSIHPLFFEKYKPECIALIKTCLFISLWLHSQTYGQKLLNLYYPRLFFAKNAWKKILYFFLSIGAPWILARSQSALRFSHSSIMEQCYQGLLWIEKATQLAHSIHLLLFLMHGK